jgi:hypothetical protein
LTVSTRRGLRALTLALLLVVAGCSDDDGEASGSVTPEGSTRPTGSLVPGGSVPPTTRVGPTTTNAGGGTGTTGGSPGPGPGTGDPSEGIPRDQFCRGFGQVRIADRDLATAVDDDDVEAFRVAYGHLVNAYLAMAENPPDQVYDELRAVYFLYDDLTAQVADAATSDDLTTVALQIQGSDQLEDLEAVRDYGAANC